MHTGVRFFGVPVCCICRDQMQDFIWVSAIQGLLVAAGFISGLQFAVEEILLFGILVLVKHRMSSIFDRFVKRA
jgi:hydrogenase-4 membrane subunit HyfE